MRSLLSSAVFFSLVLSTNALSIPEAHVKRANAGLYLCENASFSGYCVHYTTPFGSCNTITDKFPPGDRGVSAAGADVGNWCTLYSEENCHGDELQVYNPGYENLQATNWNDKARSYNCAAL